MVKKTPVVKIEFTSLDGIVYATFHVKALFGESLETIAKDKTVKAFIDAALYKGHAITFQHIIKG